MADQAQNEGGRPRGRRRRWIIGLLLVLVLALIGAGYAGWRALPGYIVREAARRGVELEPGEIHVELDRLQLRGARFGLVGVRGLRGTIEEAIVDLDGWAPKAVHAVGLEVALVGDEPLVDLPVWTERYAATSPMPLEGKRVRVAWSERDGASGGASVVLEQATLSLRGGEGTLQGARVLAFGEMLGTEDGSARRVDVCWRVGKGSLELGLGNVGLDAAPVRIDIASAAPAGATGSPPQVKIALKPLPLSDVVAAVVPALQPAGAPPAAQPARPRASTAVIVQGWVELPLPRFEEGERIQGTLKATVRGWVPPHPRELDGVLFGDTTEITSQFVLPADRNKLELGDLAVSAGAMHLSGTGSLQRPAAGGSAGRSAVLRGDLNGTLPCTLVARSAAGARLGKTLGDFAGNLATRSLEGSVLVHVGMEAELDHLDAARIDPTATVRCKLKLL